MGTGLGRCWRVGCAGLWLSFGCWWVGCAGLWLSFGCWQGCCGCPCGCPWAGGCAGGRSPCVLPSPAAAAAALCQQLRGRIDRGRARIAPLKRCPGAPDGLLFPKERAWERRIQNLARAAVEAAVIVPPQPGCSVTERLGACAAPQDAAWTVPGVSGVSSPASVVPQG